MSRPRRSAAALLGAPAVLVALVSCGDSGEPGPTAACEGEGVAEIKVESVGPATVARLGDGVRAVVSAVDGCGRAVRPASSEVRWSTADSGVAVPEPVPDAPLPEAFVRAVSFGATTVWAAVGPARDSLRIEVVHVQTRAEGFSVVASGQVDASTTDLWVHGDYAYLASQPRECGADCGTLDAFLYVWGLEPDGGLARLDSVALPTPKINDVKVSADGSFAVATGEHGVGSNGIILLGLADPASPTIVASHTEDLHHGVHNVWIERIDGRDYVFVVEDGTGEDAGLHVLDVTDRPAVRRVARYYAGDSFVHDVYVRDGLAFVSHWDAGLVILDVGHGIRGGSPEEPVEVSRIVTEGGNVHNAWYWPDGRVVFVGEETFPAPAAEIEPGELHVVDVSDLERPAEVATFAVEGDTPHNFWLDEEREILFAAWYSRGLRAIDVGGILEGDLAAQGRELGYVIPAGTRGSPRIWAPQLHRGRIYASDIINGIWSLRFDG